MQVEVKSILSCTRRVLKQPYKASYSVSSIIYGHDNLSYLPKGIHPRTRGIKKPTERPLPKHPFNLPQDLYPQKVNGQWRSARISAKRAAAIRKAAILCGTYGSYDPSTGSGWDPTWERPTMSMVTRPPKGRAHDRAQPNRLAKIGQNLADQQKKIAAHKKSLPPRHRKDSLVYMLSKKEPWEKDEKLVDE